MADFTAQCMRPVRRNPVLTITPAPGTTLASTFDAARWTKVVFTAKELTPGTEPVITLKYKGSSLRWVVYDADGFSPMFSQFSTKVGNVFTVLPAGGWHREPERFWMGEAVEAST